MMKFSGSFLAVVFAYFTFQVDGRPGKDGPPPGMLPINISKEQVDQCFTDVGLTREEIFNHRKDPENKSTEKDLCFFKCIGTTSGAITNEGKLDVDYIKNNLSPFMESQADTILPCLEKIGSVSNCQDMTKVVECFPKPPAPPS